MPYSLVSAATLGFDLVRLPAGGQVADVLLTGLAADADTLHRLAGAHPASGRTADERTQSYFQLASDVQYEPGLYGIAVPRHRTELRDALTAALASLVESGRYQQVLERWDVASAGVPVVTINSGAP